MSKIAPIEPRDCTFRSDGLSLHYAEWGDLNQETLILVHGNRDQSRSWDFFVRELFHRGLSQAHMVALDLRGHGDSGWAAPERGYQHCDFVLDLTAFLRHLGKETVTLIGHSLGGGVCILFTGSFPKKVRKLLLIEATGPMARSDQDVPELLAKWLAGEESRGESFFYKTLQEAARAIQRRFPLIPENASAHMARYGTKQTDRGYVWKYDPRVRFPSYSSFTESQIQTFIERIQIPTMLIFGSDGGFIKSPRYQRVRLFKTGKVVEIPGAGHHVPHEKPRELAEAVAPFLGSFPDQD